MGTLPTIEERTDGMDSLEGFLPLYWDADLGQLWMEIPELDEEMVHFSGFGAGLGSNDIGLDRGALRGSRIVKFERVGRKIFMVQPNYRFRANSDNPAETRAVRDAFARSILWSFTPAAETGGRVLVDLTDFLIRDATNAGQRMSPGTYRLDNSRSSVYMDMTGSFPTNTELEVELTFVQQPGGGGGRGGRGGGGFEGVGSVASTGEAASIRIHHSFVQLPDDEYEPRMFDPRSGYGSSSYQDYAVSLDEPMTQRFIRRHRLEKQDPSAAVSDPVEPIIYYLDPGAPEPIRSALLEGARWWNQAFEAAGYRDGFQVTLRPDSISSLDARYNVINWVHRSTRGWSTGGSVSDPRTGEIIKGVVTLGSLRVRQDYMIAEGLLSPYAEGDEVAPELAEWALARIRQLAAHEVGHALQDAAGYRPLKLRTQLVRLAAPGERLAALVMMLSPFVSAVTRTPLTGLAMFFGGIAVMGLGTLIHLVTLPTELDASFGRALPLLKERGILIAGDELHARKLLTAAAWTYVAGSLMSFLNIARWWAILRR